MLSATATNPRATCRLSAATFLKLEELTATPTNSAGLLALYWREIDDTGVTNNTDELYIGRGDGGTIYLRDRNSDTFIEVYEEYIESTAVAGDSTVNITGAPGWILPKDEYDEDDLHKFVLENGVIKEVVLETQEGHSRVVDFQTLS